MTPAKNKFIIISLVLVFSPILASAGGETQINEQLKNGGTVTLEAGTYIISSSIIIPSNTILQGTLGPNGEKLTIIQVRAHAGWASFVPLISVINAKNVVIKI
jgi:hypothetical protein